MADYSELPLYLDELTMAAIDAHMREWCVTRAGWPPPTLTTENDHYLVMWSASGHGETHTRSVTIARHYGGRGGGEVIACSQGIEPASFEMTSDFYQIADRVRRVAMEGHNAHSWYSLPWPGSFDTTISTLNHACELLYTEDFPTDIQVQINHIAGILNRTEYPDGSTRYNASPMTGEFVDALRVVLTGTGYGGLSMLCQCAHDFVVALASRAQADQSIWDAARHDTANVVEGAIGYFQDWQPNAPQFDLSDLTATLTLAGAIASIAIPGGGGVLTAGLIGVVSGLGSLAFDHSPDLNPSPNKATSVSDLLDAFDKALNGGMTGVSYGSSMYEAISACEQVLHDDIGDKADLVLAHDEGGQSFRLNWNQFDGVATSQGIDVDLEGLQVIADTYIPNILCDLNEIVSDLRSVISSTGSYPWQRPGDLGYPPDSFVNGVAEATGPFAKWYVLAEGIINLLDPSQDDSAGGGLHRLASFITNTYVANVRQCEAHDAKACQAIVPNW